MSSASPRTRCASCSPSSGRRFRLWAWPQYQLFLAAMAAIGLETIGQGHAHATADDARFGRQTADEIQTCEPGGQRKWAPTAVKHDAVANTSRFEDYEETWSIGRCSIAAQLQSCSRQSGAARSGHPMDMRAPEPRRVSMRSNARWTKLSYALGVDPLELRLENYSDLEQTSTSRRPASAQGLRLSRRREIRLVEAQPAAASDAGGARADRLRHGEWDRAGNLRANERRGPVHPEGKTSGQHGGQPISAPAPIPFCADRRRDASACRSTRSRSGSGNSDLPACPVEGGSWTRPWPAPRSMQACDGIRQQVLSARRRSRLRRERRRNGRRRLRRRQDRARSDTIADGAADGAAAPSQ